VDHARATWQVSIRRACRALPVNRSTCHYRSRRAGQAHLITRIREIAAARGRYGYRRIHVLLVHCRGGLGRAGMIAARLLVELGMKPTKAMAMVRAARPNAIENSDKEKFVLGLAMTQD